MEWWSNGVMSDIPSVAFVSLLHYSNSPSLLVWFRLEFARKWPI
jgi:hypothetical protein